MATYRVKNLAKAFGNDTWGQKINAFIRILSKLDIIDNDDYRETSQWLDSLSHDIWEYKRIMIKSRKKSRKQGITEPNTI